MATRYFHWDVVDDCVMHETDGAGATIVQYTHEPGPFGPLVSENRGGVESYHHYDALGSTTLLTDDTGTVTDTFKYDAWGNDAGRTGTTPTPYTWVGRLGYQHDTPTGGYYIRARSYQPTVARWMSVDPAEFNDGRNRYILSSNMVTIRIDPSGLVSIAGIAVESIAASTLPCRTMNPVCQCDEGTCTFAAFTTYKRVAKPLSLQNLSIFLTHFPGAQRILQFPPAGQNRIPQFVPNPTRCSSDMGRVFGEDYIAVTLLSGAVCVYTPDSFPDPPPENWFDNLGSGECKGALQLDVIRGIMRNRAALTITETNFGQILRFSKPVKKLEMYFQLDIYCGCGGFDELGRPLDRNSSTMIASKVVNA